MSVQQLYFSNKGGYIFLSLCGFEFIKIGDFYKANTPYGGKYPNYKLCIELIDDRLLHAGKSAYLGN